MFGLGHLLALSLNNETAHDMFPRITNRLLSGTSVENHDLSTTTSRTKVKNTSCPLNEGSALGFAQKTAQQLRHGPLQFFSLRLAGLFS
jgi:hypothetical protein